MKRLNKSAALVLVLVTLMVLPGCIGQEEAPPETITEVRTATETEVQTVPPEVTEPEVANPYIGSGKLDGEGVPLDFYTDIDLRKAFAYAVDYETIIADALLGQGSYCPTPIIPGLPYYNPDQTGYYYDLDKATEYFKKAWNGEVWEKGFKFTITYNIGNEFRRIVSEMVKRNVEQLNEKFFIYVRGVEWPTFLRAFLDARCPMFVCGWVADFPDDHNFAMPFMHSEGDYSGVSQRYSNPHVDDLVMQGVAETDPAKRRAIYYELQQIFVDDVISIHLASRTTEHWQRDWVNGWWYFSNYFGPMFWDYWKDADAPNPETLIWAQYGDVESLDPARVYDTASATLLTNLYDPLIYYDHDPEKTVPKTLDPIELTQPVTNFVPWLAEEVPTAENGGISADGLTYTFKIRKGIKFPNGNDLTPEDVEYSIERVMVEHIAGGPTWMFLEPLTNTYSTRDSDGNIVLPIEDIMNSVEVVGDTVVFHLAKPYAPFMHIMTQCWASILDKEWCIENDCWDGTPEDYERVNNPEIPPLQEKSMGTGPFKLEYWTHEVEYSLVKNEASASRTAHLDRVIVKSISEWSTRKLMFLAGDADLCMVPVPYMKEVEGAEGIINVYGLPRLRADCIFFTYDINPL